LVAEETRLNKELSQIGQAEAANRIKRLFDRIHESNGRKYIVARVDGLNMELLREAVDQLRERMGSGVALLGAVTEEKVAFVAGVTKDLTTKVQAGSLVKAVAAVTGGSGGGRPDLAQAGGKEASQIDQALQIGEQRVRELLNS
jgi:alanyl-tRNA synthetase